MALRCGGWWSASFAGGVRSGIRLGVVFLLFLASLATAKADETDAPDGSDEQDDTYEQYHPMALYKPDYGWRQVWSGVDVHSNGWLIYGGSTVAPFTDIYTDGPRLRATTGYGGYGWEGKRDPNYPDAPPPKGDASTNYTDALVGYYKQWGPATIKVFAGMAKIEHNLGSITCQTADGKTCNPKTIAKVRDDLINGMDWGPKASFEIWLNMGTDAYASFDANYTTAFDTYSSHLRLGYRVLPTVSGGIEAAINGNAKNQDYRGGLFVRYEWLSGEVALAGGFLSSDLGNVLDQSFYGTFNYAMHF